MFIREYLVNNWSFQIDDEDPSTHLPISIFNSWSGVIFSHLYRSYTLYIQNLLCHLLLIPGHENLLQPSHKPKHFHSISLNMAHYNQCQHIAGACTHHPTCTNPVLLIVTEDEAACRLPQKKCLYFWLHCQDPKIVRAGPEGSARPGTVTLVYNPRSVVNDQGADPLSAP